MSRVILVSMRRAILVLATFLAIPPGASLDGQTTRPVESELVERIDSLVVILSRADRVARIADGVRSEERFGRLTARIDTLQVGPFHVVTPVQQVNLARGYFERAWARYTATVGSERTSLEGHVFIFGRGEALWGLDLNGGTRVNPRFMPGLYMDYAIGRILGGVLATGWPDDLRTWAGDRFPMAEAPANSRDMQVPSELEWAYKSLVTTSSVAVADCYDGALDRCWDALGLNHRDEWATAWYTASERRSLVRSLMPSPNPGIAGMRASCLDAQSDDACSAVLVDRDAAASIPLPEGTRMTLLTHALELGGLEGYTRLVSNTDGPIKDRLVSASGVSADSLIGSWRAAILEARPDAHGDLRMARWSSLFWLLVLAGVSTRSTRWRLT